MDMKIDATVKKETIYIAAAVGILSAFMEAVFLIPGKWNYTVLLGNLWGAAAGILNFFLMGLTVQKAVLQEEKDAKQTMKTSQTLRNFMLALVLMLGILVPVFPTVAATLPLFFPRLAVAVRPYIGRKEEQKHDDQ